MNDEKHGGGSEGWSAVWSSVKDTVSERDVYYVMDELKVDHISDLLPRTGKILEVGCGSARVSALLAKRGYVTYGLDRNFHGISRC